MLYYIVMLKNPHEVHMVCAKSVSEIPYTYWGILYRPDGNVVCSFDACIAVMNIIKSCGHLPTGHYWE